MVLLPGNITYNDLWPGNGEVASPADSSSVCEILERDRFFASLVKLKLRLSLPSTVPCTGVRASATPSPPITGAVLLVAHLYEAKAVALRLELELRGGGSVWEGFTYDHPLDECNEKQNNAGKMKKPALLC